MKPSTRTAAGAHCRGRRGDWPAAGPRDAKDCSARARRSAGDRPARPARRRAGGRSRSGGELLFFGAAAQGRGGGATGHDGVLHGVEPAGADEGLVARGAETVALVLELLLLELRVGVHAVLAGG